MTEELISFLWFLKDSLIGYPLLTPGYGIVYIDNFVLPFAY